MAQDLKSSNPTDIAFRRALAASVQQFARDNLGESPEDVFIYLTQHMLDLIWAMAKTICLESDEFIECMDVAIREVVERGGASAGVSH